MSGSSARAKVSGPYSASTRKSLSARVESLTDYYEPLFRDELNIPPCKTRPVVVNGHSIGGNDVTWMFGPSSIESTEQMVRVGSSLQKLGMRFIRASAFGRGTTNGLGAAGLKLLRATGARYNLGIISEVSDRQDLELVSKYCDVFEVGPFSIDNAMLLEELAGAGKPIVLHRGPMMPLDEFLGIIDFCEQKGCSDIVIAEGGVSSPSSEHDKVLDLGSIVTLKRETPYPVLVDCVAAARNWTYAEHLAVAAIAAGVDGIIAELDPGPLAALAQSRKALLPVQICSMVKRAAAVKCTVNALKHHQCQEGEERPSYL